MRWKWLSSDPFDDITNSNRDTNWVQANILGGRRVFTSLMQFISQSNILFKFNLTLIKFNKTLLLFNSFTTFVILTINITSQQLINLSYSRRVEYLLILFIVLFVLNIFVQNFLISSLKFFENHSEKIELFYHFLNEDIKFLMFCWKSFIKYNNLKIGIYIILLLKTFLFTNSGSI